MRKFIIPVFITLAYLFTNAQNKTTFKADRDSIAEHQIIGLEYLLTDLLAKGDIDTYSGYLVDDYIRVNANGIVSTKEQVLERFRKSKPSGKMYPHDLSARICGNTAILRGVLDLESKTGDTISKRVSVITKVFIKRNRSWYMASMQGSPVQ